MAFKTDLETILDVVEKSKGFPNPTIEYNFDKLPDDKNITPDSFYGVKANKNPKLSLGNAHITYKLS